MLQIMGLGAPLLEFGARYVVWLYMPAFLCVLVGLHFLRDSLYVLARPDLAFKHRLLMARSLAFEGLLGLLTGPVVFLSIYHRKELFQCITGLF